MLHCRMECSGMTRWLAASPACIVRWDSGLYASFRDKGACSFIRGERDHKWVWCRPISLTCPEVVTSALATLCGTCDCRTCVDSSVCRLYFLVVSWSSDIYFPVNLTIVMAFPHLYGVWQLNRASNSEKEMLCHQLLVTIIKFSLYVIVLQRLCHTWKNG
jgi:hypothetical protein